LIFVSEHSSLEEILQLAFEELRRAVADKRHPFRYFAFATFNSHRVGLRTVVLRKLQDDLIYIYTDKRSDKVSDLLNNNQCSALFYHDKKKIQIRIEGHVEVHVSGEAFDNEWSKLSPRARKAYQFTHPPGDIIESPQEGHVTEDRNEFCLLQMKLELIEVLQLNKMKHIRAQFEKKKEQWKGEFIAP